MSIKCIIIDDETPAIEQMEEYVSKVPFLEHMGSYNNGIEPVSIIQSGDVDLIFLDIEMEGFTGLQLIKTLHNPPKIILTTAYDQYALKAFDLNVCDYLLKPISFERFMQSIDKIYDHFQKKQNMQEKGLEYKKDYFFVKTEYRMQRIDYNDILFIEGMKEYLMIHTPNEKVMTLQSFANIERDLPDNEFVRVHKSFIVAIGKIDSFEKNRIRIGERIIPIGNKYKDAFQVIIGK